MTPSQLPWSLRTQQTAAAFYRAGYPIEEIADAIGLAPTECRELVNSMRRAGWRLRRPAALRPVAPPARSVRSPRRRPARARHLQPVERQVEQLVARPRVRELRRRRSCDSHRVRLHSRSGAPVPVTRDRLRPGRAEKEWSGRSG